MDNNLSFEDLEKKAFHNININNIKKHCNPFSCWTELETPISKKEIEDCLISSEESLEHTPLVFIKSEIDDLNSARKKHIQKIAYFVKYGFEDPILIDVGLPEFGFEVSYMIEDGNHRLAASIIRGDKTIKAKLSGSEDYAKSLGFWNPNEFQKKLDIIS